jgi:hypothetical protein
MSGYAPKMAVTNTSKRWSAEQCCAELEPSAVADGSFCRARERLWMVHAAHENSTSPTRSCPQNLSPESS